VVLGEDAYLFVHPQAVHPQVGEQDPFWGYFRARAQVAFLSAREWRTQLALHDAREQELFQETRHGSRSLGRWLVAPDTAVWARRLRRLPLWRWPERALRELAGMAAGDLQVIARAAAELAAGDPRRAFRAFGARPRVGEEQERRWEAELQVLLFDPARKLDRRWRRRAARLHRHLRAALHVPAPLRWPPAGQQGHFFIPFGEWEVPLGWKVLGVEGETLVSPYQRTPWLTGDTLWAPEYRPVGEALHAPGIHAWGFWTWPPEVGWHHAVALVAALGHVTLGDRSWRAEGAQLLRVWIPGNYPGRAKALERHYGVPVHAAPPGVRADRCALAWAYARLRRGQLLVELDD